MEHDSSSGISTMWDSGVTHVPTVCIYHTIFPIHLEMDLGCLSPHNLEGEVTHLGDALIMTCSTLYMLSHEFSIFQIMQMYR
jgi:hypothetical protein